MILESYHSCVDQSVKQFDLLSESKIRLRQSQAISEHEVVPAKSEQEKLGKIITNENDEKIDVVFSSYKRYFGRYYGTCFFISAFAAMLVFLASKIVNDYVIGVWAHDENGDQQSRYWFYTSVTLGLTLSTTLGAYFRSGTCQLFTMRAGRLIHESMIDTILKAPVNLYFDITPLGRILNKFSKDLNGLETQMGWQLSSFLLNFFSLLQVFIVAVLAVQYIGLIIPCVLLLAITQVNKATNANTETNRLFSTTNSPLLSYIGETINGSSTIRAFNRQEEFIEGFHKLLDDNIIACLMKSGVQGWFAIRVDLIAIMLMFTISLICVLCRDAEDADPVLLSMLLSYIMTIQFNLTWSLKCFMYLQSNMVNAERCMKILNVP